MLHDFWNDLVCSELESHHCINLISYMALFQTPFLSQFPIPLSKRKAYLSSIPILLWCITSEVLKITKVPNEGTV